jgi:hypothetical protein
MTSLELQLRDLGREIEYPPVPELGASVRERLEARPRLALFPRRRVLALALAVALAAIGAVMAVPQTRAAILDFFGLRGVEVTRVDELPEVERRSPLFLGERVTLAGARERARFRVLVPTFDELDKIYYSEPPAGGQVSFLYGSSERPRLLLTEFPGRAIYQKLVGPRTRIEQVTVNGGRGVWVEGAPHMLFYERGGKTEPEPIRLVGNVLIWEQNGLTLRLEGELSKREALDIARSVR